LWRNSHTNTNGYSYRDAQCDCDGYTICNSYGHADCNTDTDSHCYTNPHTHTQAYSYAKTSPDTGASSDSARVTVIPK
jgi:hypothetical protein